MRATRVAEHIPEITDSLFDISPADRTQAARTGVHEYSLTGITGPSSATFHGDGSIESTGNARAYSGSRSDLSLLGFMKEQTNPNVWRDSLSYGQVDDACQIGMGALERIARDPQDAIRRYGKWTLGRAVKSMVRDTLDHTFSMILTPQEQKQESRVDSKERSSITIEMMLRTYPQITPEFAQEHEQAFEILRPFFSRRDKRRIRAAEEGSGPSFARLLAAEAAA